jgi:probable HAF family extracellular repeat protein
MRSPVPSNVFFAIVLVLSIFSAWNGPALADSGTRPYDWKDVGILPGGNTAVPFAINDAGQVVGTSEVAGGYLHAFLYDKGVLTDLGTLGGRNSWATAINDQGQITGASEDCSGNRHAFVYENGRMRDLGALPNGGFSFGLGIDNEGQVVGGSYTGARQSSERPFLDTGATIKQLPSLPGATWSTAVAIDDAGEFVGESSFNNPQSVRGYVTDDAGVTDMGTLGGPSLIPNAINQAGLVVGESTAVNYDWHAFEYADGLLTDLGVLPGGDYSAAYSVNDEGAAVGTADGPNLTYHGVIWTDGKIHQLDPMVRGIRRRQVISAQAINDAGQIAAIMAFPTSSGYWQQRAVVLTPVR